MYFLLEMSPDIIKLGPVGAAESNPLPDQAPLSQVKMHQSHNSEALVGL